MINIKSTKRWHFIASVLEFIQLVTDKLYSSASTVGHVACFYEGLVRLTSTDWGCLSDLTGLKSNA